MAHCGVIMRVFVCVAMGMMALSLIDTALRGEVERTQRAADAQAYYRCARYGTTLYRNVGGNIVEDWQAEYLWCRNRGVIADDELR